MLKRELLRKESGVSHSDYHWESIDGKKLYAQTWSPLADPRGVINLIHGLGEHSSRYKNWAEKLVGERIIVRSFDMRGHGRSEGKKGHSKRYSKLLQDIDAFINQSMAEYPDLPQFLYGHSLGANLVLNYATKNIVNLKGVIVTSPWLKLTNPPSRILLLIADSLSNLFPALLTNNTIKPEDLSRNLKVVHDYRTDNLVHDRISLRLFKQVYYAGLSVSKNIYKINLPLLVMHGTQDNVTSCKATREFVRNASNRTTFIEWEGGYHELHHDLDSEKVFESLATWLNMLVD
jgi:alpha-beta hydrolase superfamily lysophospholipase